MFNSLTSITKRFGCAFLIIFMVSLAVSAQQTTCTLKANQLKDTPELFGLHLGMTYDEVKAQLPLVQFGPADEIGVLKTSFNPHFDPRVDAKSFEGVRTISLDFMDGKLVTVWVGFEDSFKWAKLDDFIARFSTALNVPPDWNPNRSARELVCEGFSVYASIIAGGPSIRIRDEQAQNMIAQRREEAVAAAEAQVIGDTRSKLYYPSDCSDKDDVPPINRIIFKNKEVAEQNSYKLAKSCQ
jgi:hypothetical protein